MNAETPLSPKGWIARLLAAHGLAALSVLLLAGCEPASQGGDSDAGVLAEDASIREALAYPDPLVRMERVAQILQAAGPEDLVDLQYAFESAALNNGDSEYVLFGRWWAGFDPAAAMVYCENHLRMEMPGVILAVAREWARRDPQGFLESGFLANQALMGATQSQLVNSLVVGWFEGEEPGLEAWLMAQTDHGVRTSALNSYARMRVLRDGGPATFEWISTDPELAKETRRLLYGGALTVAAHQEPQLAVKWLARAKEEGVDIRHFFHRIAFAWAEHDPAAALRWLSGSGTEAERTRAGIRIAQRWLRQDRHGVIRWIDASEPAEWSDLTRLQGIMAYVKAEDYDVEWVRMLDRAQTILAADKRNAVQVWLLARWRVIDSDAVDGWLADHPDALPEKRIVQTHNVPKAERAQIEALTTARGAAES